MGEFCVIVRTGVRGYVATVHRGTTASYYPLTDYGSAKRPTAAWARRAGERLIRRAIARENRYWERQRRARAQQADDPRLSPGEPS